MAFLFRMMVAVVVRPHPAAVVSVATADAPKPAVLYSNAVIKPDHSKGEALFFMVIIMMDQRIDLNYFV
jgi:hypothetical protein